MLNEKRITVVLPAYNASETLKRTVDDLDRSIVDDVLLVDDASSDGTLEEARRLGLRTIAHDENRGYGAVAVARGVEEVALALGIESLLERTTIELSGGELQRVALGAALAGRPRLLVLDEPTSQLDPVAGDELLALLRRLNEEWGTTIMLAEHRLERCLAVRRIEGKLGPEFAVRSGRFQRRSRPE